MDKFEAINFINETIKSTNDNVNKYINKISNLTKEKVEISTKPFPYKLYDSYKWSIPQVIKYLQEVIELPQYTEHFKRNEINGYKLICLNDHNISDSLSQTENKLHIPKILSHVESLRNKVFKESLKNLPNDLIDWETIHIAGYMYSKKCSNLCIDKAISYRLNGLSLNKDMDYDNIFKDNLISTNDFNKSKQTLLEIIDKYKQQDNSIVNSDDNNSKNGISEVNSTIKEKITNDTAIKRRKKTKKSNKISNRLSTTEPLITINEINENDDSIDKSFDSLDQIITTTNNKNNTLDSLVKTNNIPDIPIKDSHSIKDILANDSTMDTDSNKLPSFNHDNSENNNKNNNNYNNHNNEIITASDSELNKSTNKVIKNKKKLLNDKKINELLLTNELTNNLTNSVTNNIDINEIKRNQNKFINEITNLNNIISNQSNTIDLLESMNKKLNDNQRQLVTNNQLANQVINILDLEKQTTLNVLTNVSNNYYKQSNKEKELLVDNLISSLTSDLTTKLSSTLTNNITNELTNKLTNSITNQSTNNPTSNIIHKQVGDKIDKPLSNNSVVNMLETIDIKALKSEIPSTKINALDVINTDSDIVSKVDLKLSNDIPININNSYSNSNHSIMKSKLNNQIDLSNALIVNSSKEINIWKDFLNVYRYENITYIDRNTTNNLSMYTANKIIILMIRLGRKMFKDLIQSSINDECVLILKVFDKYAKSIINSCQSDIITHDNEYILAVIFVYLLGIIRKIIDRYIDNDVQLMYLLNQLRSNDFTLPHLSRDNMRALVENTLAIEMTSWDQFDVICQLFDSTSKGFVKLKQFLDTLIYLPNTIAIIPRVSSNQFIYLLNVSQNIIILSLTICSNSLLSTGLSINQSFEKLVIPHLPVYTKLNNYIKMKKREVNDVEVVGEVLMILLNSVDTLDIPDDWTPVSSLENSPSKMTTKPSNNLNADVLNSLSNRLTTNTIKDDRNKCISKYKNTSKRTDNDMIELNAAIDVLSVSTYPSVLSLSKSLTIYSPENADIVTSLLKLLVVVTNYRIKCLEFFISVSLHRKCEYIDSHIGNLVNQMCTNLIDGLNSDHLVAYYNNLISHVNSLTSDMNNNKRDSKSIMQLTNQSYIFMDATASIQPPDKLIGDLLISEQSLLELLGIFIPSRGVGTSIYQTIAIELTLMTYNSQNKLDNKNSKRVDSEIYSKTLSNIHSQLVYESTSRSNLIDHTNNHISSQKIKYLSDYLNYLNIKASKRQQLLKTLINIWIHAKSVITSDTKSIVKMYEDSLLVSLNEMTLNDIVGYTKKLVKSLEEDIITNDNKTSNQQLEKKVKIIRDSYMSISNDNEITSLLNEMTSLEKKLLQANDDIINLSDKIIRSIMKYNQRYNSSID